MGLAYMPCCSARVRPALAPALQALQSARHASSGMSAQKQQPAAGHHSPCWHEHAQRTHGRAQYFAEGVAVIGGDVVWFQRPCPCPRPSRAQFPTQDLVTVSLRKGRVPTRLLAREPRQQGQTPEARCVQVARTRSVCLHRPRWQGTPEGFVSDRHWGPIKAVALSVTTGESSNGTSPKSEKPL